MAAYTEDKPFALHLDKSKFAETLHLVALTVSRTHCQVIVKKLNGYLLNRPRLKHVVSHPDKPELRLVLLSEEITNADLDALPKEVKDAIEGEPVGDLCFHEIHLDYDYFPAEHVLKEVLPKGLEVPSSFETIGHVAHLNLRDEVLAYKEVIAEVLFDKNKQHIKTIVNKVGTIENEFRVPQFEVLIGEPNLETEVRQHGDIFRLDYGKVYWNSRLEYEHKRLVGFFKPGDVICDMFAGIGPFAVPAARAGCIVLANDLNPDCVHYLRLNAKLNKVANRILAYNLDARAFLRQLTTPPPDATSGSAEPHAALATSAPPLPAGVGASPTSQAHPTGATSDAPSPAGADAHAPSAEPAPAGADAEAATSAGPAPAGADAPATSAGPAPVNGAGKVGKASEQQRGGGERKAKQGKGGSKGRREAKEDRAEAARPWERFDHVVMNLPASAIEFLDVFKGAFSREHWKGALPRIHCYCFAHSSETEADVLKRAERHLGGPITDPSVWTVRDVAPNKTMLCLSFDLEASVGFSDAEEEGELRRAKDLGNVASVETSGGGDRQGASKLENLVIVEEGDVGLGVSENKKPRVT